ncbi:7-cyano-7-deazaguanine tRNA-ribosyltransferase [Methanocaldococcus villosus KIN24-T80]|uniref:tRNA-guanine(15) transglycosylase n=1 Tax=Methanocaldococcus villosus KIN24-T80 TaxID=1069083 RepID=N6VRK3_9EURY|nr:tRNA guanosine(15) transglycosylase TgtA [Methanocaldococcus villosus]ENN96510.1 7-cyano-7-deazaguanine tRNA-ribosyltransferase [Methanocaldococcus villosus KIN24-T80]
MRFEIKYRDGMGRVCLLEINNKKIETPTIMPVVHPNPKKQSVPIDFIKKLADIVITNSYIIYKNKFLREIAEKLGVHKLLNFDKIVVTDSGSYQLSVYGKIDVEPNEIIEFQERIGVDVGTILDIPTPPDVDKEKAERDLEETLRRAKEAIKLREERGYRLLLNGTIQGSTYLDLRKKSAIEMSKLNFDIYPIGAVVPLMESYRFREVVEIIINSKMYLPNNKPIHLFGCGHPMFFSLAVLLGCDLFDSAAYSLYAKDGRYLTETGTLHLEEMKDLKEFPCSCPVCLEYKPNELYNLDEKERERLLAEHNLYVTFEEINKIKEAIKEGSLWEFVEKRVRAHPKLLEAYRILKNYMEYIEKFDPVTKKSAFFYTGIESLYRPEVLRHKKRLKRIKYNKVYITNISSKVERPYSEHINIVKTDVDILIKHPIFGLIPYYIDTIYPLSQHEAPELYDFEKNINDRFIEEFINWLRKKIGEENILDIRSYNYYTSLFSEDFDSNAYRIRKMLQYQYGYDILEGVNVRVIRSKNTGRLRKVLNENGDLLFSIRSHDNFLIPSKLGAKLLWEKIPFPKYRVVVNKEAEPFVKKGRNVFAKFIVDADEELRPYEEVIVVNENDELLAYGTNILNGVEMREFNNGLAVKVRGGIYE